MKRTLLALIALAAAVAPSCTKQDNFPSGPDLVTITIGLTPAVDSGRFPTKGIGEDIAATLPSQMTLSLTNKATGESFEVVTGASVRIPAGTYTAAGRTSPAPLQFIYDPTHYTSREPLIVVEDELEITTAGAHYVTAGYRCFVAAIPTSEVSYWWLTTANGRAEVARNTGTENGWIFVIGDFGTDQYFRTGVTFVDGEQQEYQFQTRDLQAGSILAEYGKWYLLRQQGGTPQNGTIALRFPEWTAGN